MYMAHNLIEYLLDQIHPEGTALTSDWSTNSFIMVVLEKILTEHFMDNHYENICRSVRSEYSSYKVI